MSSGRDNFDDDSGLIWLREEPGARRAGHSRAEIARAAVRIADSEGFDAVSMRRVAQELDAGTMTLYHYVRNKEELVTLMHDAVMGEVLVPDGQLPATWREAITAIAKRSREAFRRHAWTLEEAGDTAVGPNGIRHFEQSLQAVQDTGLPVEERVHLLSLVDEYVFGFSLRESSAGWGSEGSSLFPREALEFFQRQLETGAFPHISALFEDDPDAAEGTRRVMAMISRPERFERGLEQLLDGVELGMRRPKASGRARPKARHREAARRAAR